MVPTIIVIDGKETRKQDQGQNTTLQDCSESPLKVPNKLLCKWSLLLLTVVWSKTVLCCYITLNVAGVLKHTDTRLRNVQAWSIHWMDGWVYHWVFLLVFVVAMPSTSSRVVLCGWSLGPPAPARLLLDCIENSNSNAVMTTRTSRGWISAKGTKTESFMEKFSNHFYDIINDFNVCIGLR